MFSKNGIPSLIIEESLQVVQDETNIILEKLGATIRIEFTNFKQLKSWEDRCLVCGRLFKSREMECPECNSKRQKKTKDELILKIYEGDKETNFEQDSGGGKVLISVAIRLALMRLLIRKSNSKIKFVVLDEIFGMLDQVYRKSMLELIRDFVIKELNIDQVFIISHTEISDYIDDIILITRHDKYSTFSWL
jgi:ABC-type glutathione transport system ATPase component